MNTRKINSPASSHATDEWVRSHVYRAISKLCSHGQASGRLLNMQISTLAASLLALGKTPSGRDESNSQQLTGKRRTALRCHLPYAIKASAHICKHYHPFLLPPSLSPSISLSGIGWCKHRVSVGSSVLVPEPGEGRDMWETAVLSGELVADGR